MIDPQNDRPTGGLDLTILTSFSRTSHKRCRHLSFSSPAIFSSVSASGWALQDTYPMYSRR